MWLYPFVLTICTGHGWDEALGGRDFDMKVAKFFARKAEQKLGEGKVMTNKRTLERLLRESRKVKEVCVFRNLKVKIVSHLTSLSKQVLSANLDSQISLPDLVPDYDFFSSITREEFEKECADLLSRAVLPVQKALESANLTPQDIDFVEVIGGGSRVPSIHAAIAKYMGREDVDRHLNGDEAAVFGAAFYAATQSTSFRVKNDILLKDATAYGIGTFLSFHSKFVCDNTRYSLTLFAFFLDVSVSEGVSSDHSSTTAHLIKSLNRYGSLKKLSFHVNDHFLDTHFSLRLFYENGTLRTGAPVDIAEISFSGLPSKDKFELVDTPKVTLAFRLSPLGLVVVEHADVEFTILTLEKEKKEKVEDEKENTVKEGEATEKATEPTDTPSEGHAEEPKKEGNDEKKEDVKTEEKEKTVEEKEGGKEEEKVEEEKYVEVKRVKKVPLKVEVKAKGVLPLSTKEVADAKKKLRDMDAHDKQKFETEEVSS